MLTDDDLAAWIAGLDDLFALVAGRFFRVEPRLRARAYVRGLLAPLASKNGWTLAEAAGNATPDGMQRLLNRAAWDVDGVRDDVRGYAARRPRGPVVSPVEQVARHEAKRHAGHSRAYRTPRSPVGRRWSGADPRRLLSAANRSPTSPGN